MRGSSKGGTDLLAVVLRTRSGLSGKELVR